jgi:AcrR family transcriptional regulator
MESKDTQAVTGSIPTDSASPAKEKIFQYALSRFFTAGFAHVSVNELTANLGMSKKTFYKCFTSKEDLLEYMTSRLFHDIAATIQSIVEDDAPFMHKFDRLMKYLGAQVRRLSRPMIQDMQRFAPAVWERVQEFRREQIVTLFGGLIAEGQRAGHIRRDINTRVFLLAYLAAIEEILNPSLLMNESFSAGEALQNILAIFFHGVLTDQARKEFLLVQQTTHV